MNPALYRTNAPVLELVLRAAVIYFVLLILLRVSGKRELGEMSAMELVSVVLLSDAVQNSMVGTDTSLPGGIIVVSTLIGLSTLNGYLGYRFKKYRKLIEGDPTIIIRNGKIIEKNMRKERIAFDDLMGLLRAQGIADYQRVKWAIMEASGSLSVIQYEPTQVHPDSHDRK